MATAENVDDGEHVNARGEALDTGGEMKTPNGVLIEEYITSTWHFFENNQIDGHDNSHGDGHYTGRYCFRYSDGTLTRWYTKKSMPKWMRSYLKMLEAKAQ
jgi:hypothetical protein